MGLFNRKKVDGHASLDAPVNDRPVNGTTTTDAPTTNGKTGISRFAIGRRSSSRTVAAGRFAFQGIRVAQFLLAVLILGLVSYALNVYSATFLTSAYVPALVAAVLTILATILLAFWSRVPGFASHPLSAGVVDLFFALFWLAIMAELAAYSDVVAPRDVTYYTGALDGQSNSAYVAYSGTINRLKRAWACGAAAAAFAGVEFILFLVGALLPLRGRFAGPVSGTDSVGIPTNKHGSVAHNNSEPAFEMQTRGPGYVSPTSPTPGHGASNTSTSGTENGARFMPTPPGQHEAGHGGVGRENMI